MGDVRNSSSNDASAEASSQEYGTPKQTREQYSAAGPPSTYRRSLSGSLSSLSFLRSSSSSSSDHGSKTPLPMAISEEQAPLSPPSGVGAMSMATQQITSRRRRGSLRKTALLGTGRARMVGKERRASNLEQVNSLEYDHSDGSGTDSGTLSNSVSPVTPIFDVPTPRPLPVPPPVPMVTHPVHGDPSKISASSKEAQSFQTLQRPSTAQSTASTTDEDELPTSSPTTPLSAVAKYPFTTADSYFPPQQPRLPHPRQTIPKSRSPLATLPPSIPSSPPSEWDYSETRWWGWIILLVTWVVFVVGMGSCFEVWSWAWDVGETPYAPPELEDDPTLPIVGYYPALIVLTCVMAWVWVTIAWVGMKYFKHANISGEES